MKSLKSPFQVGLDIERIFDAGGKSRRASVMPTCCRSASVNDLWEELAG